MDTITHPTSGLLAAHAAGSTPRGIDLLIASHLTFCPACRDRVRRLETVGGALLALAEDEGIRPPDYPSTLARIESGKPIRHPGAPKPGGAEVLPAPIRRALGTGSEAIRWRFLIPGVSVCNMPAAADEGEDVRLVRVRPGARLLSHTHEGDEATLILAGALRDGGTTYRRGDVSLCGPDREHRPEIVGSEECICLLVLSGRMRFTGSVGRVLNLFAH
jgi:putative transcriptional regulator